MDSPVAPPTASPLPSPDRRVVRNLFRAEKEMEMPVNMVEDISLDLELSEEETADWEELVAGVYEGGAFLWCKPCGTGCSGGCSSCSGC